jgi:hypothetical protein
VVIKVERIAEYGSVDKSAYIFKGPDRCRNYCRVFGYLSSGSSLIRTLLACSCRTSAPTL